MRRLAALVLVCVAMPVLRAQPDRPLPDRDRFLAEVRNHLDPDDVRQSGYMYVETRREKKIDGNGRATSESIKVIESYPGFPGEERWERLISEDGRPVSPADLAKLDRDRQKRAEEFARRIAQNPAKERELQDQKRAEGRRERAEAADEVFRVFDLRLTGRETIDGHDTIVIAFRPRSGVQPRSRPGRIMQKFSGRAWISESDYEPVKVEAEAIDTVSFGLGILARLHKGSHASFQRRKVNGEAWLPATAAYTFSARVGLLAVVRRAATIEYSNYKKFSVDSTYKTATP